MVFSFFVCFQFWLGLTGPYLRQGSTFVLFKISSFKNTGNEWHRCWKHIVPEERFLVFPRDYLCVKGGGRREQNISSRRNCYLFNSGSLKSREFSVLYPQVYSVRMRTWDIFRNSPASRIFSELVGIWLFSIKSKLFIKKKYYKNPNKAALIYQECL